MRFIFHSIIILTILTSCSSEQGNGVYIEYGIGPLMITIDNTGNLSLSVSSEFRLPLFLGSFRAGYYQDAATSFNIINSLIVRENGVDNIYDLQGQNFSIDIDEGYFEKMSIHKYGNNITVEIIRLNNSNTSNEYILPGKSAICKVRNTNQKSSINIRSHPTTDSNTIYQLAVRNEASVIDIYYNNLDKTTWYLIQINSLNIEGWIRSDTVIPLNTCKIQ